MGRLSIVAQQAMDLYYKDFAKENDFFDLAHFQYLAVASYAKLLQDEYELSKITSRQEWGFSIIELSNDWLKTIRVKVEKSGSNYFAKLPERVFAFPFDSMGVGIQNITFGGPCGPFTKVSLNDEWKVCLLPPTTRIFYAVNIDKLVFYNVKCKLEGAELEVNYVPEFTSEDDDFEIPSSKELQIVTKIVEIMRGATAGVVVDKTNDNNPNAILETDVNNRTMGKP